MSFFLQSPKECGASSVHFRFATVLPRLQKASKKLKTRSLSQSNAVPSKAIILRVSYQDHLGDVAILNLGKSSRVQSSSQVDLEKWEIAYWGISHSSELHSPSKSSSCNFSPKFIWVNSNTSNCERFEQSHQDRLDTEVVTPSRPANAPSLFAKFGRQLLVSPQDALRPNQRFHLLQIWPGVNEACCWPLVSYGKLMLCRLCCLQGPKLVPRFRLSKHLVISWQVAQGATGGHLRDMILHMLAFRFCDWIRRKILGESQCLLVPQPIALQRANCLGDLFVCANLVYVNVRRIFGWCHLCP